MTQLNRGNTEPVASCKPVIGLIGGIGAGKTEVAAEFARRGALVVSGDEAGHEALRQPAIRDAVAARWGRGVLGPDGEVNRRKVAAIVFKDPAEREALEKIVFPWIGQRLRAQVLAGMENPAVKWVILDAAILLEAGWADVCDRLLFVDAPRSVRLERVAAKRGWMPEEVESREKAQLALDEKRSRAHAILDNAGSREAMTRQVDALLRRWECDPESDGTDRQRRGSLKPST